MADMPHFEKGPNYRTPFGKSEFLRSTQDIKTESYTCSAATVPTQTIDGVGTKVLQPGTVMATVTATGDVGPYQVDAVDGRQLAANIVGINYTFLPWQLNERDVEISVVYEASVVQAWCVFYDTGDAAAGNAGTAVTNAVRDLMVAGVLPGLSISFH
jgi:hypothetical protein